MAATLEACTPINVKKELVDVLKGIVEEIDQNKACAACGPAPCPPAPAAPAAPKRCRLPTGKAVPPLISEPDYRKRGLDDWNYVIPLPEPLKVRSREIIASHLYSGCSCQKRNGLQDNCRRWDCRGAPHCCKTGLCKNSGGAGCDGSLCRKG